VIATDERLAPTRMPLVPARLRALAQAVRAGGSVLREMPIAARIAALDRLAASWLSPTSPWRDRAMIELPMSTGLPAAMIEVALANLWNALRAPDLTTVAATELDDAPGHEMPGLALHVLAGNVPGVGIFGVVAALLAGIPSIVKPATREPFLPALLVESIAVVAPELQRGLAVAPWRGGSAELDAAALGAADVVLAYGRDVTLDRLAARQPRRLLRYGDRLSVALIARSALGTQTARALARETALYDQQGCLSPQIVVVEDAGRAEVDLFAALVAAELGVLEHELPRAAASLAEQASVWRWLERQRWRAQEGADATVHGGRDGAGSVVCDRTADWPTSPTFRNLVVIPTATLAESTAVLRRFVGTIEAIGYAGPSDRLGEVAAVAADVGAHRLCPLERLQAPPFSWRQSGHHRLAAMLGRTPADVAVPFA
jgi:acyl-CoA reductase-like NAD-dependent aldehyde dehydrogenase